MLSIAQNASEIATFQEYRLPHNLSDFENSSELELEARNYLLSKPVCLVFTCGEIRALIDMSSKNDNRVLLKYCFEKLAKLPFTKWIQLVKKM